MINKSGVATKELVLGAYPSAERRSKGAFAVVECFQKIPCNPCYSSCSRGAMKKFEDINDLPEVYFDKCNGCAVCVSNCPGLAIFVIDETFSATHALVKLPYEFLPLPAKGDVVKGTNREGVVVCDAKVENVVNTKTQDRTPVVWLSVPKELSMEVRSFVAQEKEKCSHKDCVDISKISQDTPDDAYICRCEEITVKELRSVIAKGYTTLNEIKIVTRAGMGSCQGRTCRQLIMNEISRATGQKHAEMPLSTFRPPVKPIKMSLLCKKSEESENE